MNEENEPGHGREETPDEPATHLPANASPAECLAALRTDLAGLEEVSRWQWNLIQRMKAHADRLPTDCKT